ncbi:MAG: heme exporter protein CcmD [Verrucomicrobiae bacterium]|nr:heme exporter protein CcmD [Verrucomicrobiae bacterium]
MGEPWTIKKTELSFELSRPASATSLTLAIFLLPLFFLVATAGGFALVLVAGALVKTGGIVAWGIYAIGAIAVAGLLISTAAFHTAWLRDAVPLVRRLERAETPVLFSVSADRLVRFANTPTAGYTARLHRGAALERPTLGLFGFFRYAFRKPSWFSSPLGHFHSAEEALAAATGLAAEINSWLSGSRTPVKAEDPTAELFPWLRDPSIRPPKKSDELEAVQQRIAFEREQEKIRLWESHFSTEPLELNEGAEVTGGAGKVRFRKEGQTPSLVIETPAETEEVDLSEIVPGAEVAAIRVHVGDYVRYNDEQAIAVIVETTSGHLFQIQRFYSKEGHCSHRSVTPNFLPPPQDLSNS